MSPTSTTLAGASSANGPEPALPPDLRAGHAAANRSLDSGSNSDSIRRPTMSDRADPEQPAGAEARLDQGAVVVDHQHRL